MRLSKRAIDAASYRGGTDYRWFDSPPGFGLRLYASGTKSFVVAYHVLGRKRIMVLGRYGVLTPTQAKTKALKVLVQAADGIDPSGERKALRRSPTVENLATRFLEEHAKAKKKASSVRNDRAMWKNHVLPRLGKRKVASVSPADIDRLHSSMRGTPYAANRVVAMLSKAFNLAEVWGWRPNASNPCRSITRYKEHRRERYLSAEEMHELGKVLTEVEREQDFLPSVVPAIRLLLFTGCRLNEILSLRWRDVDAERSALWLPDSKTGGRLVPVCTAVFSILDTVPRMEASPWVLPGRRPEQHLVNLSKPWSTIRQQAAIPDVRLHDLRHTFASVGAGIGLSLPLIGKMLGHTQAATTARYAHLADDPVRRAVDLVGSEIAEAFLAA